MAEAETDVGDVENQNVITGEEDANENLLSEVGENEDGTTVENEDELLAEKKDGECDANNEENGGEREAVDEEVEKIKDEHYSQNKPNEFSSENFKIELGGLPKYYPLGHLKKLLNNTLQLDAHKVKPGGLGRNVAYVNFKDEDARFKALTILNGYKWQGSSLTAEKADPAKDPMLLAKIDFLKVPKKEHEMLPLEERIQKAVTPYHNMPYEEQLKEKEKVVRQVLRKFGNELSQMNPELKKFVHWHKIRRKGQICELDDIVESPVKEGYRNKCEFTIGKNSECEKPVVGFRVASYKEGSVEVGPISHLRHLNEKMKLVVKIMEKYLEASEHEPFDPFSHKGIWRQLTVRTSNNDDVMLIVVIHPQEMEEDDINAIKEDVKNYFAEGEGKEAGVTSIFFQQYGQKESGKDIEYEHIYGKTYIEETILGKTFKASPDAFLQVNTPACEVLYSKISEVAEVDPTSIVLDICCGVGTIGLAVAESAYKMLGVELTSKAVDDARSNAEVNGVTNAIFYNGKAEDYIDSMIEKAQRVNTIAIVDPPRAGLSGSVMNALRKCEYLDKLVYVSCDPQAAVSNFQALGRPRSKTYKGSYFVPIKATPVDLFPDTPHFELIIVFERYDECKWDRIMSGNPRPKDQAYFDRVPELKYDAEQHQKERQEKRKEKDKSDKRSWEKGKDGGGRNWGKGGRGDSWSRGDNWSRRGDNWSRRGGGGRESWGRGGGDDSWSKGGGRGRRRDDWGRSGDGEGGGRRGRDGDGSWSGGGGWGRERGGDRNSGRAPFSKSPRNFREDYDEDNEFSSGYQEGFQAGLEALGSQYSGFGQGGGWNMGQTQGAYGPQGGGGYNMNNPNSSTTGPKGNQGAGSWGFDGNSGNYNSGAASGAAPYNSAQQDFSTQPVTYPASITNPMQSGTGYGYQSGGWNQNQSGSNWSSTQTGSTNNQLGSSWNQNQYQSFEEPPSKKWKTGTNNDQVGYDYSNY